jgi:hypothetical protein
MTNAMGGDASAKKNRRKTGADKDGWDVVAGFKRQCE